MQLTKTSKGFYYLITFSLLMLFLLGGWWLYLVFKLANKLYEFNYPGIEGNLISMIQWEGLTFFIFLLILISTLLYIYIQDHKKTKSLQAFFASLTHELKTPLASMKLQSQVLAEILEENIQDSSLKEKIKKYIDRLAHDNLRLEDQLDNHLQLSRVERNAPLNLRKINLVEFIKIEIKRYEDNIDFTINSPEEEIMVEADDFALQTIIRNLIENSIKHVQRDKVVVHFDIDLTPQLTLTYRDNGDSFKGDKSKLGHLFYKFNSPKGSGIGLYLMDKLAHKMNVKMSIQSDSHFILHFVFPLYNGGKHA